MSIMVLFHRRLFYLPNLLLVLIILLSSSDRSSPPLLVSADALGCHAESWCVLPFCRCESLWSWMPWVERSACQDGYSGTNCQCPFEVTNIADRPFWQIVPDSLTGSLAVTSASVDGTIMAGTWTSGYEWSSSEWEFQDARRRGGALTGTNDNENVWSITKTSFESYLLGTPSGIQRRDSTERRFELVFTETGAQGHFVEVPNGQIFAGTFDGLFRSVDDGNTWVRTPSDSCLLISDEISSTAASTRGLDPRPPENITWCEEQVTYVMEYQGNVISFFSGYVGAYYMDATSTNSDPLLESSWMAFPTFQNSDPDAGPCFGGFCHVNDAVVFQGSLYVAFMSKTVYRIPLLDTTSGSGDPIVSPLATWEEIFISESANDQGTTALATVPDETSIYVSTVDGLYRSSDGDSNTWELIPTDDDNCSRKNRPPLLSRGLVSTAEGDRLIMGTVYGPWIYRIPPNN